ncbi:hypothetical protein Trydic_g8715 [Trypoxylus dichotomus]
MHRQVVRFLYDGKRTINTIADVEKELKEREHVSEQDLQQIKGVNRGEPLLKKALSYRYAAAVTVDRQIAPTACEILHASNCNMDGGSERVPMRSGRLLERR